MRITNGMLQRSSLGHIQSNLRKIAAAQQQVSTGLRIERPSDDPIAAADAMRTESSLRALAQYKRNIQVATGRASAEEGVLERVTESLSRARELGVAQGTATADAASRRVAQAEVDQLLEFAVQLGNTRFADGYLFGGNDINTPPLDPTVPGFASVTPAGEPRTEIGAGHFIRPNHNADQIFLQPGVLTALQDLSTALGANDQTAIRASTDALETAFNGVQSMIGDIGARSSQLQVADANLDALEVNLRTFKSDLVEVDLEQAMTELVGRQTAYQAAMMATSRVLSMNLADYLQ